MLTEILFTLIFVGGVQGVHITRSYQEVGVVENVDSVTLPCHYRSSGNARLQPDLIKWTRGDRNGRPVLTVDRNGNIVPGSRYQGRVRLGQGADLVLTAPSIADSSTYTCSVTISTDANNPTAFGAIVLRVQECVEPDTVAAAICITLDIILILSAVLWFVLNGRTRIIRVKLHRRIVFLVAIGSTLSCIASVIVFLIYVSEDCVQALYRLRVAGIVFCIVGILSGILFWLLTARKLRGEDDPGSLRYTGSDMDGESERADKDTLPVSNEKVLKITPKLAMLDTVDGLYRSVPANGGRKDNSIPGDAESIRDDLVKIIPNKDLQNHKQGRFEQLRTRDPAPTHVDRNLALPSEVLETSADEVFLEQNSSTRSVHPSHGSSRPSTLVTSMVLGSSPTSPSSEASSPGLTPVASRGTPRDSANSSQAVSRGPTSISSGVAVSTAPLVPPSVSAKSQVPDTSRPPSSVSSQNPVPTSMTVPSKRSTSSSLRTPPSSADPFPLTKLKVPGADFITSSVPLRKKSSMRKARSEEVLKNGLSLPPVTSVRRSLPLSIEEKLDQDIFLRDCERTAEYFIETAAYKRLQQDLQNEDTKGITLIGEAGDGKTATAMYAAWKLHSKFGYLPLKVRTISEIERIYIEGLKLVFVLDDPFGKLCASSELQDYWISCSKRLQACLTTKNVKVIATVRSDIWQICKYSVMRFHPFSSSINISEKLTRNIKHSMLLAHLRLAGIDTDNAEWKEVIQLIINRSSNTGYSQCCHLLRCSESFREIAPALFQKPALTIRKKVRNLRREDPVSFCVLALLVTHGCKLSRTILQRALKELPEIELEKIDSIWQACRKKSSLAPPSPEDFQVKVDWLCNTYLVQAETSLEFSLTSLAEATLQELAEADIGLIFKWCHPDVIIGKLVPASCRLFVPLTSQMTVFVKAEDYAQLVKVLTSELLIGNVRSVLLNPAWKAEDFIQVWKEYITTKSLLRKLRGVSGICSKAEIIHRAAAQGLEHMLAALIDDLDLRQDVNLFRNEYGQTLLHSAAVGGDENTILYLLKKGCQVDAVNDARETPLYLAALRGSLNTVKLLLKFDANPDFQSKMGLHSLHAAIFGERTEVVAELLTRVSRQSLRGFSKNKIGITSFRDQFLSNIKHTDLHEAARTNDLVRIHHLLDNGFDRNRVNWYGWSPLYITAMLGHVEAAALLLTRGANPNSLSHRGFSPLDEACSTFSDPLVSLLHSYSPKRSSTV